MIATDNIARFVYESADEANGPMSSRTRSLASSCHGAANSGSSDDVRTVAGIPVGGVFAGASGLEITEQAPMYGGTGDELYCREPSGL